MSELAKEYVVKLEWLFIAPELPPEVRTRAEAYDYIREAVTQEIMSFGFDSWGDVSDALEISESVEKVSNA